MTAAPCERLAGGGVLEIGAGGRGGETGGEGFPDDDGADSLGK